jgi:very-short-patch-repair endonuclease
MEGKNHHLSGAAVWGLAQRQHGVVARRQLLALGFKSRAIERRLARGRLHPVMPGVYAVGRPGLTRYGRWMAAVVACGSGAVLSHGSAAALWGIGEERRGAIEISVRTTSARRRSGIRIHRRLGLRSEDLAVQDDIPVTSPVRTLVDLATFLSRDRLERAVNEADKRDLTNPEALRATLERFHGQRGAPRLRTLLDRRTFRLSDSDLELWFRPLARDAGLPEPLTKQWVNGFEVDFYWPGLGLVVEADGLRYHRTPSQQARGLRRDQAHAAAGMTPLRFSHEQIRFDPDYVRSNLAAVAAQLSGRSARA